MEDLTMLLKKHAEEENELGLPIDFSERPLEEQRKLFTEYTEKRYADWEKKLEERKQEYYKSGMGVDFNKKVDHDKLAQDLANFMEKNSVKMLPTPTTSVTNWFDEDSSFGTSIEAEQVFQQNLHDIVNEMKVNLVDEKKILEGTVVPKYVSNFVENRSK